MPKVTCQRQVYSVLAPRPKACTGEGGVYGVGGWNVAVSRVSSRTCEAGNKMRWGGGVVCRPRLQEAVPSSEPGNHRGALRKGDPPFVARSPSPPPTVPPCPRGSPEPMLGPTRDPAHSHPAAGPACSGRHSAPVGVGGMQRVGPTQTRLLHGAGSWGWSSGLQLRHRLPDRRRPRRRSQWGAAWRAWLCVAPPVLPG